MAALMIGPRPRQGMWYGMPSWAGKWLGTLFSPTGCVPVGMGRIIALAEEAAILLALQQEGVLWTTRDVV